MNHLDHEDLGLSNESGNEHFEAVADRALARRAFLRMGVGAATVGVFAPSMVAYGGDDPIPAPLPPMGFSNVAVSTADTVIVPAEYKWEVVYAWGDPINGVAPVFKQDGSNSAAEQTLQSGMHHDGGHFFSLPDWKSTSSTSGVWAVNHEYVDPSLLLGPFGTWDTAENVAKSKAAHGCSIVEFERTTGGQWEVKRNSPYARRITADTEIEIAGPARGHALLKTSADPTGTLVKGTINNCAAGNTPWGTYVTCEENFNGPFGTDNSAFTQSPDQRRYGLRKTGFTNALGSLYPWFRQDQRFDLSLEPNESNRFGYVVEIDPYDPTRKPVKRTALGRFKHENCEWLLAKDGRVAFYMGCDEVNEYIYKFVTAGKFNRDVRAANLDLLDSGTLYVAKFNDDGTGAWLELSLGKNGLTAANGWTEQAQIHIRTRQAADRAGATMMDRPEWVATNKKTNDVFVTLTNNGRRGTAPASSNPADGSGSASGARPAVDNANPRGTVASGGNAFGHIIRWKDDGDDSAATTFKWSVFVLAGDPQQTDDNKKGNINGDAFGSPDGLWVDDSGYLWIQTDVSTPRLSNNATLATPPTTPNPDYKNLGNNQMLMADPNTRKVKRFLVGPSQCEITGVHMTPDRKTMFVNIQHPGEDGSDGDLSATPKKFSSWPDGAAAGRPRSATIAITRKDGGIIGT